MVRTRTRRSSGERVRLSPFGWGGLDKFTNDHLLDQQSLRVALNVRLSDRALGRREGARKLVSLTDPGASMTFGSDAKYAQIPAATQLAIGAGGFAIRLSFVATRPGAGNTAYILSSRVSGQAYHVLRVTIDEDGDVVVGWTKESDKSDVSVTVAGVTSGSTQSMFAIFDAHAGTFTVYLNGVASGTAVTGISSTEKPVQASTDWHFGVHYDPATVAVVANTHFDGAMDAFCLLSLAGTRPTAGSPTLASKLVRDSLRSWPLPQSRMVLSCFDFNEASGATLTDRSRFKNDGTLVGSPTLGGAALAQPSVIGQHCRLLEGADGARTNVVAAGGAIYTETVRAGAA